MFATASLTVQRSFKRAQKIYAWLTILVIAGALGIGYREGRGLLAMRETFTANAATVASLEVEKGEAQTAYTEARTAFSQDITNFAQTIDTVLPHGERYTELTRLLDDYFAKNFDPKNPIVASGLRFGHGQPIPGTPFASLPFNLTITSSPENFFKFLKFMEQSGAIETGVRFMEVQNIRVNFSEENVSFTVDLTALYRPTNGNNSTASSGQ